MSAHVVSLMEMTHNSLVQLHAKTLQSKRLHIYALQPTQPDCGPEQDTEDSASTLQTDQATDVRMREKCKDLAAAFARIKADS